VTFANPAGLWLLALALPVLALHVLRPRRDEVRVSSVFLWRDVEAPVSAARPWQKLRPSILLFLQLLAVVGLALAVARPVRLTDAPVADHTVFIVDASASMAAADGDPDRLAAALAEARRLRAEIPDGGVASIVVADARPRVVLTASADRGAFDSALDPIEPAAGAADFAGAFVLAESLETPDDSIAFVFLSDGGLTDAEQALLPPGTVYESVGEESTNRAITRLTVEPASGGLRAFVTVANTGGPEATQTVRLDVDGETAVTREVTIGAGESVDVQADLPAGERVQAFLEGEDLLDVDDRAYAVAPSRRDLDVLLAGPDDPLLDALLAAIPGVTVTRSATGVPAPDADLAIYNQVDVPADPQAPFWAIAPPAGAPGVTVTGTVEAPAATLVRTDDPLLSDVDLSAVAIRAAQRLEAPTSEALAAAEGTPLLVRGAAGDLPYLYLGFPLAESNLPLQVAFPILGDRIVSELGGSALPPQTVAAGAALPIDAARDTVVTAPGGRTIEVPAGAAAPHADQVGFWTVAAAERAERAVAVNPALSESDLTPAPSLLVNERTRLETESPPRGERPVLAWVVLPLLAVVAAEWLFARRRSGVSRRQFRVATALRVAVALALIGALLDLAVVRPGRDVAVMLLVDASDSLGIGGQGDAVAWANEALDEMPGNARAGVALFGGDARLEAIISADARLGQPSVQIDPSRTDLAGALRLAAAVLPSDARRRVVLVSDGRATAGDVLEEARRLRDAGIEVDVRTVARASGPDAAVAAIDAPGRASQGETVTVTATVVADRAGPALVTLLSGGDVLGEQQVDLVAGENTVSFPVVVEEPGLARYQVRVTTASDAVSENDVGYAAVQVEGPPRVLLLEGRPGAGESLAGALQAGALTVDVVDAGALPPVDELAGYSAIVMVDVDARSLAPDQVSALSIATRDLGRGLVTVGGPQSYGLGGYLGSELEQILPVVSDILDPQRRQSVAEVLAIDTSGSMGACHCAEGANGIPSEGNRAFGGIVKTDIARAGAARAIEALSERDEIGVLALDTNEEWVLDLQQLPAEEVVTEGLRSIQPTGDGTDLTRSLTEAAAALQESDAALKHVILFTDGFTDPATLAALAEQAAELRDEQDITVSVLATGEGSADELEAIAVAGGGRFYPGRNLEEIPQIMQQEAVIASRNFINEGEFLPTITSSAQVVAGLEATPPLAGYVATTSKPQASTHLRIGPDQDPLLASWNVGLGRATSWTSDGGDRWAAPWSTWDGYVDFWSTVVKDVFPRNQGQGGVSAELVDGTLRVTVEGDEAFPDGSEATARVTGPDLTSTEVRLERVGGDTFAAEVPVDGAGSYAVAGAVTDAAGAQIAGGTALANVSYSAEYEPGEPDSALLARVSEVTGGRGEIEAADAFDPDDLAAGRSRVPLAGWFLLAAALAWPVAVAVSRLALSGSVARSVSSLRSGTLVWVRGRLPGLPGRPPAPPARPGGQGPSPRGDGTRPPTPERRPEEQPRPEAKPSEGLGALLASQRRRRGVVDAADADTDADSGGGPRAGSTS
jgi:Mg-chelatase subunit ChlD